MDAQQPDHRLEAAHGEGGHSHRRRGRPVPQVRALRALRLRRPLGVGFGDGRPEADNPEPLQRLCHAPWQGRRREAGDAVSGPGRLRRLFPPARVFSESRLEMSIETRGKSRLARWARGGALTLAFSAAASAAVGQRTVSLQDPGSRAPEVAAVDPATVQGLPSSRAYRPPEGIAFKATDFISENVRLTAQWFYAAGAEGKTLPTVIMAHGWGATAANFREDAVELARAGYLVMLFDYRGWGDSDGRVMLAGAQPVPRGSAADGAFTAPVRELRGYIDP